MHKRVAVKVLFKGPVIINFVVMVTQKLTAMFFNILKIVIFSKLMIIKLVHNFFVFFFVNELN